jgi:hypothetical protein
MDALLGFDGYFREGVTAPVRVTVSNDGPDLEAEIQLVLPGNFLAATADALYVRPVSLPSRSRKVEYLYVPGSSDLRGAQVVLVRGGAVLARVAFAATWPIPPICSSACSPAAQGAQPARRRACPPPRASRCDPRRAPPRPVGMRSAR